MKLFSFLSKLSIIFIFLLLSGCSISEEEAIEGAKEAFRLGISTEAKEPNEESAAYHFYLPPTLTIEETADTNMILSKGKQLFLVFSNPAEAASSKVNFEEDQFIEEKAIFVDEVTEDDTFYYLIISPFEEEVYKVIVGLGGDKVTTVTDFEDMSKNIETMVEMLKSIVKK